MQRRDVLKGVVATVAGTPTLASAQIGGPFANPTLQFKPGNQHELPSWAFSLPLYVPPVPLPHRIGKYEEVSGASFGNDDPTPVGESFHGIAREWGETPKHWEPYGCTPGLTGKDGWEDKQRHFGTVDAYDGSGPIENWSGFRIKCYKIPIQPALKKLRPDTAYPARLYTYAGGVPGPTLKMRLGEPVVVRFVNHLEAEVSVHLHGGHSPSHSDGFPTFYVLQGKGRDYFYPNILPLFRESGTQGQSLEYSVDVGESQSTMWYHDHAMDATGYNVSKGLAGFALCFGEEELKLIHDWVLPGYGPKSCIDPSAIRYRANTHSPTQKEIAQWEDPKKPGYFMREQEPYFNPFDIPIVLQDKVIDRETGQISFDLTSHDGYLGDTFFVNGVPWPKHSVRNRKYRFRILNGSNARIYRLRLMTLEDFTRAQRFGIDALRQGENDDVAAPADTATEVAGKLTARYDAHSLPYLRIGKDSWLWSQAVEMKSLVLAMANRADIVIDFHKLTETMEPNEVREFVLVNTMPQFDGRGPKAKLEDGGDPRVLPLPFDVPSQHELVELVRPIGLMKFTVRHALPGTEKGDPPSDRDATVENGKPLSQHHRKIKDEEIVAVREFIFERGKGAWQISGRFYDPFIANAAPLLDGAEEWVLRNGGGGWWHPIHIHLESHQLVSYEKDFDADEVVDLKDPPDPNLLANLQDVKKFMAPVEVIGLHDTQVLGPNTVARIRMRHRSWNGPFVFHCHNLEHEDMRMMYNFEPTPSPHDPDIAPDARTHGNNLTLHGDPHRFDQHVGELRWTHSAVPRTPVVDAGVEQIRPRPQSP